MFDIGFWELAIIGVVGLLVIGPERLPGVARTIGLYVGKLQRFVQGVKTDIQQELDASELREMLDRQDKQLKELQSLVSDTRDEVGQAAQKASNELDEAAGKYHGIGSPLSDSELTAAPTADSSVGAEASGAADVAAKPAPAVSADAEEKASKHA